MGIYTTLTTTNSQVIGPAAKPRVGLDRSSAEQLLNKALVYDPSIRTAYAARDEVQTIPEQTDAGVGDTYTLTFTFPRQNAGKGLTFTTAGIAYDAIDSVIETAIDVAATAATWTAWTNADISVSMAGAAGLDDGTVTLTFDGASVSEEPCVLTVLTATGWTQDGVIARTTPGQTDRNGAQALFEVGAITGAFWICGNTPSLTAGTTLKRPRAGLITDLAMVAAWEDGNDAIYDACRALYPTMPPK